MSPTENAWEEDLCRSDVLGLWERSCLRKHVACQFFEAGGYEDYLHPHAQRRTPKRAPQRERQPALQPNAVLRLGGKWRAPMQRWVEGKSVLMYPPGRVVPQASRLPRTIRSTE